MDILFANNRLKKACNIFQKAVKEWGNTRAGKIYERLKTLRAADCLEDVRNTPGDCHEYKHRKDYCMSMDLDGGWRLLFIPATEPIPTLPDGSSLNWSNVTTVMIVSVEDPHDRK
ncbi:MAG: killer suppression protein [Candidatus Sumerlaeota bacterium]|nr:killer suppression protein [Candidatus Sumerlaeota bacterium]